MKNWRISSVAIALCAALLLGSCRGGTAQTPTGTTPNEPAPTATSGSPALTITTAAYEEGNICLRCPQTAGLSDEAKQTALNKLIQNDVWQHTVGPDIDAYPRETITYNLDYTVTLQTENLLSVLYTGSVSIEGGIHPSNVIYAATFDLQEAKKLSLSDFATVDAAFVDRVQRADTVAAADGTKPDGISALIQSLTTDEMIRGFTDGLGTDYYTFHLTPDALIVSVPVVHAAGDYALITLPGNYRR